MKDPNDDRVPDDGARVGDDGMDPFVRYYAEESESRETVERFLRIRELIRSQLDGVGDADGRCDVADIGCGAGTQCFLWAELGHRVHGIDINEPLVEIARRRALERNVDVELLVGTSESLPWADRSMDVCIMPELLEHVPNWRRCLDECCRVLRPGGVIYLSTTNALCPVQQEYDLPAYSWYPGFLKRRYERLAVTTRPELVNHAKYPAVNWFTVYRLRSELDARGFDALDRFDVMDLSGRGAAARLVLGSIRTLPPIRFLAHVLTPYSMVVGVRRNGG